MQYKPLAAVDYIAVHCAATRASQDVDLKWIDRVHRQQGWFSAGYHYFIKRDGTVEFNPSRHAPDGTPTPGSHVRGFNHLSIGICLAGGVAADSRTAEANFTPAQMRSLARLLTELRERYPNAKAQGHRDFPNVRKACPSFDVPKWIAAGMPETPVL